VVGALFVPRLEHRVKLQLLFAGSVAAFGVSLFGFASVNTYWVAGIFGVIAGACIATVTVAGNSYVMRTTSDELRGRVFTSLEAVIKVSMLLSMVIMAPLADLADKIIVAVAANNSIPAYAITTTGSRLTLQFASLIVLGAAVYAFKTLSWRTCDEPDVTPSAQPPELSAEEATHGV